MDTLLKDISFDQVEMYDRGWYEDLYENVWTKANTDHFENMTLPGILLNVNTNHSLIITRFNETQVNGSQSFERNYTIDMCNITAELKKVRYWQ